jgi:hypothetical protein
MWSAEQVLALAPDEKAVKNARGLAHPRKWLATGTSGPMLWGEFQGSGKHPYQTTVDMDGPAFHCTCPSRKQPCKHVLGLFLLFASEPASITDDEPPAWVIDWFERRSQRVARQEKPRGKLGKQVDAAAQQRRSAEREAKVQAGMEELERWLRDIVRRGLAEVEHQPPGFWEAQAARMVDAQAAGVARMLREVAQLPASGGSAGGRAERMLQHLTRVYLLLEGYKHLESLPAAQQADVRRLIGWNQSQEELLQQAGLCDDWLVLGQYVEEEGSSGAGGPASRLRTRRTWLWGVQSQRAALLLHFAHGRQSFEATFVPGSQVQAELVFYPGSLPLRALVKHCDAVLPSAQERGNGATLAEQQQQALGYASLAAAMRAYGEALATYPWLDRFPLLLQQVVPVADDAGWSVRDGAGHVLRLAPGFANGWLLLAVSGGYAVMVGGEWDGEYLLPLGVWSEGRFWSV